MPADRSTAAAAATSADAGRAGDLPSVSVAVVTYERPAYVARCLDHLLAQTRPPLQIIVVDSSEGDDTARLVRARYPSVRYEASPAGRGATATARNIGYVETVGDVLAFVDDDAFAEPDWLERLLPGFEDPSVGGVGGRQIRHQPGELAEGIDTIGRLRDDGVLTGNFAADPGRPVEVDHLLGANMAFRRAALDRLGGIRDGYRGTCIREETDLCLQVAHEGYRLIYTPDAVVEHVAGPYAKGRRFDLRYAYWAQKNHLILLIRNFGLGAGMVRAYLGTSLREALGEAVARLTAERAEEGSALRSVVAGALRAAVVVAASVAGVVTGTYLSAADRRRRSPAPGR